MKFLEGSSGFAVEVRSEYDYSPLAEQLIAAKRSAYFAAGRGSFGMLTYSVPKSYDAKVPDTPRIFCRGEIADAEPSVPG